MKTVIEGYQDVSDEVEDKGASSRLQHDGEAVNGREGPGLNMTGLATIIPSEVHFGERCITENLGEPNNF